MIAGHAPVWDNHVYCAPKPGAPAIEGLERHRRAGVDVTFLNLGDSNRSLEFIVRMAAYFRRWIEDNSERFIFLNDAADIDRAIDSARMAVGFNVEGAYAIGEQLDAVMLLRDIGVRWMSLAYNRRNLAGSGVHDPVDEGLTPFGKTLIAEFDRTGIIKCLSHTGYRTAMDVLTLGGKPCIFSHSNARALHDHARNIPDELIKTCAAGGGVIGVNGVDLFLGEDGAAASSMARHIDYIVQVTGPDHAGIGLDYGYLDGGSVEALLSDTDYWPSGNGYERRVTCAPPETIREVAESLGQLGYSSTDICKVLGGNMRRVAEAVWGCDGACAEKSRPCANS